MELGEYIYRDIEKDTYLISLYTELLKTYTSNLFNLNNKYNVININDLLRFSDLLSKSTNVSKKQIHNNIAQNIVVLLNNIFPDDDNVKCVMASVLSNIKNYRGAAAKNVENYYNTDIREFIIQSISKEQYKISINGNEAYFLGNQREIFNTIKTEKFYSYSGPTSMGKTFVIKTFIINQIEKDEKMNFVVIVPTKALISEITSDFIMDLKDILKDKKYKVINTPNSIIEGEDYNYIMIYTQERYLHHLLNYPNIKSNYVFIDEAHKIFNKDYRSVFFYKILDILHELVDMPNIIFSSPLIENPDELLKLLPITSKKSSNVFKFSPVNQQKYILDYKMNNIRIYNDLTQNFIELDDKKIDKFDICYILNILGKNNKNIVYCDNTSDAINLAIKFSKTVNAMDTSEQIEKVKKYISEEIHPDYFLIDLLSKGIAYHIGYIPSSIRKHIEELYKGKLINTIFCTSTLLEGVNLPADNLFISVKEKTSLLNSHLDFKNLIGRVGRIKYNLIGNVFIIPEKDECIMKKCSDIIKHDVPNQELSINGVLTINVKKKIINMLKEGNTTLDKNNMSFDIQNFIRFSMNCLINDIVNGKSGNISKKFDNLLTPEDVQIIKNHFKDTEKIIPKDVSVTLDQIKKIDYYINKNQFKYPEEINYMNILSFLETLYDAYEWERYESHAELGKKINLKHYSVILNQWMNSMGISQIIKKNIEYHKTKNRFYDKYGTKSYEEYTGSPEQKNVIINDTLNTIEKIVLFKLSNYFLKFSKRYMEINNINSIKNDWYEFIEYGTNNRIVIHLQKLGFSREISLKILKKEYYIYNDLNDKLNVKLEIFDDTNESIIAEANKVKYNNYNVFI